jgi:hypothetical protein
MLWAEEQKVKNAALKIHPIFKTQAFVRCFLYCLLLALLNGFPAEAQVAVRPASQIRNDTIDWMKKVAIDANLVGQFRHLGTRRAARGPDGLL